MAKTKIGKVMILLKGDYDSNAQYIRLDAVKYQGSLYIARKDNVGIAPTNSEYWQLSAEKGDKPINGVDYNTEAEKEEFKEIIIADGKEAIDNYAESKKDELDAKEVELENSLEVKRDGLVETMEDVIDGFEQNVVEKTNAYNDNASSKTTIFNTNVENKTNEFNANSQEITNSFNSNATSKTNAFDLNATNKTNQFDTNVETKTSEFDSNASEKLEDYNYNAIEKTEQFNENSTRLQEQVDNVAEQMPWKSTDWVNEKIQVDDAFEYNSNKVEIKGRTEQQTYSGKNKYNTSLEKIKEANTQGTWNGNVYTFNDVTYSVNDDLSVLVNGTASSISYLNLNDITQGFEGLVEGTEYTLNGCPEGGSASTYALRLYPENNIYKSEVGAGADFTYNTTIKYARINVASGVSVNNVLFKPMITLKSETDKTFERFVGGIASPNMNFPQPIYNVIGDVVVENKNTNLFNFEDGKSVSGYGVTITYSKKDGSIILNGTAIATSNIIFDEIALEAGKYFLSVDQNMLNSSLTGNIIQLYDNVKSQNINLSYSSKTYSTNKTFSVDGLFQIRIPLVGNFVYNNYKISKLMLSKDTQLPFVIGQKNTATFPLTEGQYLAEGDYLGDDYKIHHKRLQLLANEFTYQLRDTKEGISTYSANLSKRVVGLINPHILCTHFADRAKANGISDVLGKDEGIYWYSSNTNPTETIYINSKINTLTEFKQFLTDNNVRIEYDTQEEWIEDMTPAQQLAYDKLKRMGGFKDITYVSATSDDLNPSFKFTYMIDLKANDIKQDIADIKQDIDDLETENKLIPAGGTKGQALVKLSDEDRDVEWQDVADEDLSDRVNEIQDNVMDIISDVDFKDLKCRNYTLDSRGGAASDKPFAYSNELMFYATKGSIISINSNEYTYQVCEYSNKDIASSFTAYSGVLNYGTNYVVKENSYLRVCIRYIDTTQNADLETMNHFIFKIFNGYLPKKNRDNITELADKYKEVEDIYNALPTEKASGEELEINDAKEIKSKSVGIDGKYKQETTQGYNLFSYAPKTSVESKGIVFESFGNGSYRVYGTATESMSTISLDIPEITLPDETLYMHMRNNVVVEGVGIKLIVRDGTSPNPAFSTIDRIMTSERFNNAQVYKIAITGITKDNTIDITFTPSIERTENITNYEKYTGGIPSPNPDYPQEIEQVEEVEWVNEGENLFDNVWEFGEIDSTTGKNKGTSTKNIRTKNYIKVSRKRNITMLNGIKSNTQKTRCYDKDFNYLGTMQYSGSILSSSDVLVKNATLYDSVYYLRFELDFNEESVAQDVINGKYPFMLVEGTYSVSNTPSYKEYRKKELPIDLAGNKLCAVSDEIKDKLFIDKKGNVVLKKNVIKLDFPLDPKWKIEAGNKLGLYNVSNNVKDNGAQICSHFKTNNRYANVNNSFGIGTTFFRFSNDKNFTTSEEALVWLEENNPYSYCEIETPEYIELPKLTELPKTFEGVNYITAETNLGTTNIEVEYVQDIKKLIENLETRLLGLESEV